jgi:hypothetical protein
MYGNLAILKQFFEFYSKCWRLNLQHKFSKIFTTVPNFAQNKGASYKGT